MPLLALMSISFLSCNDAEETPADETNADTTVASTSAATAEPAFTSAKVIIIRHKVKDYSKWKAGYDAHDSARLAHGVRNFIIGRGVNDSNMVMVAAKVDDVAKAKEFGASASLKKAMADAGVTGTPKVVIADVPFLTTVSRSDLRVMSFFGVKDWEAWRTSFESGKQFRLDNGIEDRGFGHDVDDNHKVVVVGSVLDSAKVVEYYKSDSLKNRMKAAGVEGTPERLWYRVVASY